VLSKSDFTNVPIKVVFSFKNRSWGLENMLEFFVLLVKVISVPLFFFTGYRVAEKTNKIYKRWSG
jgi:hypothetical protein